MTFLNLFIVNKSGGLIHHRPLSKLAPHIGTNDWLRIGSTFHSLHAIAAEASPVKNSSSSSKNNNRNSNKHDGIEFIEAEGLILCCFQTRTGIKFVITAEPGTRNMQKVLRDIYVSYTDCTLKDPFYELEMPIRCELFTQAVDDIMRQYG